MKQIRLKVRMIDGHKLRKHYPDLIGGSHRYADKIVPKGELWIEKMKNPKEHRFFLAHEGIEYLLMHLRRLSYPYAHGVATKLELALRKGSCPEATIKRYCVKYLGKKRGELCAGPLAAAYRRI